jgi:hypothetical protein
MGEFVITHRKYLLELKALLVAHRLPRKGNRGQTTIFLLLDLGSLRNPAGASSLATMDSTESVPKNKKPRGE